MKCIDDLHFVTLVLIMNKNYKSEMFIDIFQP